MSSEPSYDPAKSYLYTLEHDQFGLSAGMIPASQSTRPIHTFSEPPALTENASRRLHEL
jgi:hypothetical protein